MRRFAALLAIATVLLGGWTFLSAGCGRFAGPEEQAIGEMLRSFVSAVEKDDREMALACLMDQQAFMILNPDAAARTDPDGFAESVIAELVHTYQSMVRHFQGRTLKVKSVRLGTPWYQFKPHPAFRDNELVIDADGEEVVLMIKGVIRIGDRWRIVDLSDLELY